MSETPPVRLPGHGALLPDGTHITEDQFITAIERCLAQVKLLAQELETTAVISPRATDGAPFPPVNGREPCRSEPELYFPLDAGRPKENKRAKEMCSWCHVEEQCLAYALTHAVNGIWGGTTEAERRKVQKERQIPVVPMSPPADLDLMIRAARRGTPTEAIAALVGISPSAVGHALRNHELQEREAAS